MWIVSVLVAALAAWLFGAGWYMALADPWMRAAGIRKGPDGRPENSSPLPFVLSAIAMILVSGMMRHVLQSADLGGFFACLVSGFGVGLFFISPWIMINNAYGGRPFQLTLIDSGYAVFGCTLIGAVLSFFL